jgi:hypothetical protein
VLVSLDDLTTAGDACTRRQHLLQNTRTFTRISHRIDFILGLLRFVLLGFLMGHYRRLRCEN